MQVTAEELLKSALAAAFPERGSALYREVRRWFDDSRASKNPATIPPDDGERRCALCDRPGSAMLAIVRMLPATKRLKPRFQIPGADAPLAPPPGAFHACSACLYGYAERMAEFGPNPSAWPHPDMVLTDARRALAAEGSEAAAALAHEIDERRERTAPRRAGTVTCQLCAKRRVSIAGPRGRVCLECVGGAHRRLAELLGMLSRLGSR